MNKISTEKAIEVLYTVRAYYANLTLWTPKGEDCKGIEDVTCSEIANSCLMAIKVLEQEPKTGHWIQTQEKDDAEPFILWECSCCHKEFRSVVHKVSNYCPNCGVKMVEPQKSEEQSMKSRITGRIEEWWKSVCRGRNCKYYLHEDYPSCSYCTCPDNCIVVKEYEAEKKSQESEVENG